MPTNPTSPNETTLLLKAAKGGFFGFLGTIVGKSLTLFLQILVSRFFGPKYYGIFITGLLICQITQIISGLGLQKGGMRFLAIAHDQRDYKMMPEILKTAVLFPLVFGTFIGAILYGLAPFLAVSVLKNDEIVLVLKQFSFAVPFFTILRISADLSRAFKTTKYAVIIEDLLFSLLQIIFFITFYKIGFGFSSVVYSFILATMICSFWMLLLVRHQIQGFWPHPTKKQVLNKNSIFPRSWRPILLYSIPLTPFGLLLIGNNFMDIIMLNIFTDSSRVGEYAAAARWIMFFGMVSVSLELIFGPLMAGQLGLNRNDQVKILYRSATRWGLFVILPISVFQLLSREPLMLIFGKNFLLNSPNVLGILVIGAIFSAVSGIAGLLLTISGHQYIELAFLTGNLLINMLLNLLWIPRYGLYGAALANILSTLMTASVRIMIINKVMKMHPFSIYIIFPLIISFILIIGGLVIESIFILNMGEKTIIGILAGGLTLLSITINGFDKNDRELLITIKNKIFRN